MLSISKSATAADSDDTVVTSNRPAVQEKTRVDASVPPPPNGGTRAWLQVLGAFFLNVNTWGMLNTFGVFQTEYTGVLFPSRSQSDISWIGSIQAFLMLVVAVLCGRALDAGYFYTELLIGIGLEVLGLMILAVVLAQGVAVGIGAGMTFIPGVAIVGTYFTTRRSTAQGLAATGSCIGGIAYPIALRYLIRDVGFPWAVRIVAFIMLATLLISIATLKPRLPPRKSGPLVDIASLQTPAFSVWLVAVFLLFIGLYIPFFYIEQFARGIAGVDDTTAFYMLIVLNGSAIPGRILPSMIADRLGNLSVLIPAVGFTGVITLAWIGVASRAGLIMACIFLGIVNGSVQALVPSTVPFLCPDLSKIGTNIGITLCMAGLGLLIGNPVAGAILAKQTTATDTDFTGTLVFSGVLVIAGAAVICLVRYLKVGFALVKA